MDIVDRMFELVKKNFPQQKDFADAIGETESIVSEWRNRKSESFTRKERLPKIAAALNTTVNYLMTGQELDMQLRDPLAGIDKEKDYLLISKCDDGHLTATPMVPKSGTLPPDAQEVARAYMSKSFEVKNIIRASLGLAPLIDAENKIS